MTPALVERVVRDLREFSPDLFEVGIAEVGRTELGNAVDERPLAALLDNAARYASLLPVLLRDAGQRLHVGGAPPRPTLTPRGAAPTRRASDYAMVGGQIVPWRWRRSAVERSPPLDLMEWLLHLTDQLESELACARERYERQHTEAAALWAADSTSAQTDGRALDRGVRGLRAASRSLQLGRRQIETHAGRSLQAREAMPTSLPATPAWAFAALLHTRLASPLALQPDYLRGSLHGPIRAPEFTFLYQRWCGLKLLQCLLARGWAAVGEASLVLVYGGKLLLRKNEQALELWVEPRLSPTRRHPSGIHASQHRTPDYLICVPSRQGRDAFVLDATMSVTDKALRKKGSRYLPYLYSPARVAGLRCRRKLVQAWAAAPVVARQCRLLDEEGSTGIIPMNPENWSSRPLEAWVGTITAHGFDS